MLAIAAATAQRGHTVDALGCCGIIPNRMPPMLWPNQVMGKPGWRCATSSITAGAS